MKHKWITWLVLLALAVGIAPAGRAVGREGQRDGWTTYEDADYGYSIAYPAEWTAVVTLENQKEAADEIVIVTFVQPEAKMVKWAQKCNF